MNFLNLSFGELLGLAGIGYFFLGLADPALPSVLLVRPPAPSGESP